ncbi:hypothetical protein FALBO_10289 [Fusarium albosuccineum]|uniref:Xylanolytic transcriptional activator regulatory domain-containing protein n=1 Tax=Fusarium albosuccineum TaxID=1237068 RepID=A0A8H4L6A6_9HYPO|nr:hypothetical protein FALBO_10289 [Fusarium albosuccineum]
MPPRRACDVCYKRKFGSLTRDLRTTSDVVQELSRRVETLEEALQCALCTNMPVGGTSPWPERPFPERPFVEPSSICPRASPVATTLSHSSAISPSDVAASTTLAQTTPPKPTYKLSRCQIGNNWYFKGIGILSERGRQWISDGAGERVFLDNFDIFSNPLGTAPPLGPATCPERPRTLPSKVTCRHLVEVFFKSKTSIVFAILERSLFEGTIARAYGDEAADLGRRTSAEACLWAMIAVVVRTTDAQQLGLTLEPDDYVHEASRLLTIINGNTNLDSLQGTLLLWACQKMRGQCREASVTFTSACRMVCDLGGHFPLSRLAILPQHVPTFDDQTKLHVRRLFWMCYCYDKDISLRTDKPPLLTSDHCDVTESEEFSNQSRDTNLAKIKENAIRLLCSPRAFKYTESELLAHVRQLDDELEEWRLSVEPRYRPRLSILSDSSFTLPSTMSLENRTYFINLQLDYLFTIINIHTLVRKCGDLEENLPDDLHSVVHSSADLSIEASRSIFRILDTVVDFWKEDSAWVVSHYAPMASMPLFMNILIHPLGHTADSDLHILSSISSITRKIPAERLSIEEIEHIREISEFVMELVRLSHSAAWKVKRGERKHDLDIIHE